MYVCKENDGLHQTQTQTHTDTQTQKQTHTDTRRLRNCCTSHVSQQINLLFPPSTARRYDMDFARHTQRHTNTDTHQYTNTDRQTQTDKQTQTHTHTQLHNYIYVYIH